MRGSPRPSGSGSSCWPRSRQPGFAWLKDGKALEWLLGSPALGDQMRAGKSAAEILAASEAAAAAWRAERRPFLLY